MTVSDDSALAGKIFGDIPFKLIFNATGNPPHRCHQAGMALDCRLACSLLAAMRSCFRWLVNWNRRSPGLGVRQQGFGRAARYGVPMNT